MKRYLRSALAVVVLLSLLLVGCGQQEEPTEVPGPGGSGGEPVGGTIELMVWAQANEYEHWRVTLPEEAAEIVNEQMEAAGDSTRVVVDGFRNDTGWGDYKNKYALAADAGEAPHIVCSGHEDAAVWGNTDYILPFDACRTMHPEYDNIIESLWDSAMWSGKLWGVPQDTEARPMYFSKTKLAELGWSDAEIADLPDRIRQGEFTLEDLIATAQQAIDMGVVEPGHGYWHRPSKGGDFVQFYFAFGGQMYDPESDKLVINEEALVKWYNFQRRVVEEGISPEGLIGTDWSIWHDTVARNQVLFWNGGVWHWADWALNYIDDLGGQDYLFENVGYALQPAGEPGMSAGTLSHPLIYFISSEDATGDEGYYEMACRLLAETSTAELNTKHAVGSAHLGINANQADYGPYVEDRFLSDALYMLDYAYYQPNHVMYGPYFDILWDNLVLAVSGDLTPQEAADQAINLLQIELGDTYVIFD